MVNDQLRHWGIKGMRWGVRRYQNKDGSLTEAGKRRLRENESNKPEETVEEKKARILKSRSAKELYENADLFDDKELQSAYNRLNTERNIQNLMPKEVSRGEKIVDDITKWSNKASNVVNAGTNLYKSVDGVRKLLGDDKSDGITKYLDKKISDMTDDELGKAVTRATREKTLKRFLEELEEEAKKKKES